MTSVAIIMEGGGERASGRATIRQGMDQFLAPVKQLARERAMRWKLTPWGSRSDAYRRFRTAVRDQEADVVILLVDSEGPVHAAPKRHLADRDGWNPDFAGDNVVHLMVQSMETWIVAASGPPEPNPLKPPKQLRRRVTIDDPLPHLHKRFGTGHPIQPRHNRRRHILPESPHQLRAQHTQKRRTSTRLLFCLSFVCPSASQARFHS